ncbi:NAD-dependent epimerase/dehydratase family protein [Sphingobacterium sp. HJSM2_6]|uniref:NAD-dependent epimerase/dehydratase family protein n=1 Tax=Sphingobacterium sp. HJSM2_6 TaxID=3366264 RepID=UPI003BCD09AD
MKKKIFVTGASGFVGTHLVEKAHLLGFEVHAAIRKTSNIQDIVPYVDQFIYPDLGNTDELIRLFNQEQYHYIIHAAALTKAKSEESLLQVNVGYTEAIMQAAFKAHMPLERVVYVSSLAAIGPIAYNNSTLIDETFPYQPVTGYGRSKQASELMLLDKFSDKPITIFRPTAVYGPREKDLFILFDTLNRGLDPYIGRKPQKLSFVYVKDLVDVLIQGCLVPQGDLDIFNISDGELYPRYAMADIFKDVFAKKTFRLHIPYQIVHQAAKVSQFLYKNSTKTPVLYPERLAELTAENWGVNIHRAMEVLGYNPQYRLKEGLEESLQWYKQNNWL